MLSGGRARLACIAASLLVSSCEVPPEASASTAAPRSTTSGDPTAGAPDDRLGSDPLRASGSGTPTPRRLAFVGDVALALEVARRIEDPTSPAGYPFQYVADRLRSYDLLVGNLECVVTTMGAPTKPIPLTAPPSSVPRLLEAGFDLVSIANNHTLDRGPLGYRETLRHLGASGLDHVGHTHVDFDQPSWVVRELDGLRIAVIGHYNRDPELAEADVRAARAQAQIVIAFVHWGNEYTPEPTAEQRRMGRALIDAGAHAVVGAHAHVVQPLEHHDGRPIVHGLGNFVFPGMVRAGTRAGALLELDVDEGGVVDLRFVQVELDAGGVPRFVGAPTDEPPVLGSPRG